MLNCSRAAAEVFFGKLRVDERERYAWNAVPRRKPRILSHLSGSESTRIEFNDASARCGYEDDRAAARAPAGLRRTTAPPSVKEGRFDLVHNMPAIACRCTSRSPFGLWWMNGFVEFVCLGPPLM